MPELAVASQGAFGITPQQYDKSEATCKGIALPGSPTWHWFSATRVGFGLSQVMAGLPPAVAQSILPRGMYKDGVFAGGAVELIPSLENDFGWLLLALSGIYGYGVHGDVTDGAYLGAVKGVALPTIDTGVPGTYVHVFTPEADRTRLPYVTARKKLPSPNAATSLGIQVSDCRVTGAVFNIPASGVMSSVLGLAGITPSFDNAPAWMPSYDAEKFPVCSAEDSFVTFEINGSFIEAPVVGATLTLDNGIVPPNQMRVVGSPYAFDLPALGPRVASIRATILIDTTTGAGYELFTYIMANAALASASTWSSTPYKADVHLRVVSPFMAHSDNPYTFEFLTVGGNCVFSLADNLPLQAGGPVALTLDLTPVEITAADVDDTASSGSTTTLTKTAAGWTIGEYVGWTLAIDAAAAPGGESRIVTSNTANTLTIDANYPFSVAISTHDFRLLPPPWLIQLQNAVTEYVWPAIA